MAFCPKCGTEIQPDATSCPACGIVFTPAEAIDSNDRTAEFTAKDISENKVFALVAYAFGFIGIIVALLGAKDSPFTAFHVRQALKIAICQAILIVCCVIPFLGWIVAGIGAIILLVLTIIQFVRVCKNQATEVPILCGFGFLR